MNENLQTTRIERMERVKETLVEARSLVDYGWTRGRAMRNSLGLDGYRKRYCIVGSLVTVAGGRSEGAKAMQFFLDEVNEGRSRRDHVSLPFWNDRIARDKTHVLHMFDRTIATVDQEISAMKLALKVHRDLQRHHELERARNAGLDNALFA